MLPLLVHEQLLAAQLVHGQTTIAHWTQHPRHREE